MVCSKKELNKGTFFARKEEFAFERINKHNLFHLRILKDYMKENYIFYNEGFEVDIRKRFKSGFYDNSFLISDCSGMVNSIAIFYKIDIDNCWLSVLFVEGSRCTVPLHFSLAFWHEHMSTPYLSYNTTLDFVWGVFMDTYGAVKLREDPACDIGFFNRYIMPKDNIIKLKG
jgi:hypothetical protein